MSSSIDPGAIDRVLKDAVDAGAVPGVAAIAGVVSPLVEGPSGRAVTTRLPRVVASRAPEARTLRLDEIVVVKLVARGLTVDEVVPGGFRVVPRFDTPGVKLEGRF